MYIYAIDENRNKEKKKKYTFKVIIKEEGGEISFNAHISLFPSFSYSLIYEYMHRFRL
jgi:hypothetical protein